MFGNKGGAGSKDYKVGDGRPGVHKVEMVPQYVGHYKEMDFSSEYGLDRSVYEPAYMDIGDGVSYKIPPTYGRLPGSLKLPKPSDMRVEEFYLTGTLGLGLLASMMSADKSFGVDREWEIHLKLRRRKCIWSEKTYQNSFHRKQFTDAKKFSENCQRGKNEGEQIT